MWIIDKTLFKFLVVGVVNTVFGSAIMFAMYNLAGFSYWISSCANYIAGSVLSFFLNKYFTFGVKQWTITMVFLFVLTIAVSYGIAYGAAKPAMNYLLRSSPLRVRENAALFTGMCLFTGINYLGQRLIVFKKRQNKEVYQ